MNAHTTLSLQPIIYFTRQVGIKVRMRSDRTTAAFTNIRWKSATERDLVSAEISSHSLHQGEGQKSSSSSMRQFLEECAVWTPFEDDFLPMGALKEKYDACT